MARIPDDNIAKEKQPKKESIEPAPEKSVSAELDLIDAERDKQNTNLISDRAKPLERDDNDIDDILDINPSDSMEQEFIQSRDAFYKSQTSAGIATSELDQIDREIADTNAKKQAQEKLDNFKPVSEVPATPQEEQQVYQQFEDDWDSYFYPVNDPTTNRMPPKDIPLAIGHAAKDALKEFYKTFLDISEGVDALRAKYTPDAPGIGTKEEYATARVNIEKAMDIVPEPESEAGKTIENIAQFGFSFAGASKILKPFQGAKWIAFAAKQPKLAGAVKGLVAGAIADFAGFDPFEGRLVDFFDEKEILPKYIEWLTTDQKNMAINERFKNTLEGAGLGVFADAFFSTLGKAVNSVRGSSKKKIKALADEINETPKLKEAYEKVRENNPNKPELESLTNEKNRIETQERIAQKQADMAVDPVQKVLNQKLKNELDVASGLHREKFKLAPAELDSARKHLNADDIDPIPDKAANINLAHIDEPDEIKSIIVRTAQENAGKIDEARRGIQTHEETLKLADEIGISPKLLTRRIGETFNAEEITASRQLLAESATTVQSLARRVSNNADERSMFEFRKAINTHYAIQMQVSGLAAEAGRALNAFKITASSNEGRLKEMMAILDNKPGKFSHKELAEMISAFDHVKGLTKFIKESQNITTRGMLYEAWINGLLSGPITHTANITSNTLTIQYMPLERSIQALIGKATGTNAVKLGEVPRMYYAMFAGMQDAFKLSWKAAKNENFMLNQATKTENTIRRAISAENVRNLAWGKPLPKSNGLDGAIDLIGNIIRMPGRMLNAEDAFFKTIGYRMELHAQAYRMAVDEGLKGKKLGARIAQILDDPEIHAPQVKMDAENFAKYVTYTNDSGAVGQVLKSANRKVPALKMIVPFVNTPVNIAKFSMERTPGLALFVKQFREDLAAGGARRDLALAKQAMGSMIAISAYGLYAQGIITGGGPSDPQLKQALYRSGWQPYSIKVGDKYYSYQRLEPLSMIVGTIADSMEIIKYSDDEETILDAGQALVAGIAKNLTSKTFLRGIADFFAVMNEPDRHMERYLRNFAGSVVPNVFNQVNATSIDPTMREVNSILDELQKRVPGFSDNLPPRRDLWGEPITREGALGLDLVSPIYISTEGKDPIDKFIVDNRIEIEMPRKTVSFGRRLSGIRKTLSVNIELTPNEYDRFIVLMNQPDEKAPSLKEILNDLVTDKRFENMPVDNQEALIKNMISKRKTLAKNLLLQENAELRERVNEEIQAEYQNR